MNQLRIGGDPRLVLQVLKDSWERWCGMDAAGAVVLHVVLWWAILANGGEREECERLAPAYGAKTEVRLWDGSRVDLLSDTHAWEVDYAAKHHEAVGQALYYSLVTGKRPGVVLLVRDGDERFVYRCQSVCAKHGIALRVEEAGR